MKKLLIILSMILLMTAIVFAEEELVIGTLDDGSTYEVYNDGAGNEIFIIQVFEYSEPIKLTAVEVLVEIVMDGDGYFYAVLYDGLPDVGTNLSETTRGFGEGYVTENEVFRLNFSEPYPVIEANTPYFIIYKSEEPDMVVHLHHDGTTDYSDGDCYIWETWVGSALSCDDTSTEYPGLPGDPRDVTMSIFYNNLVEEPTITSLGNHTEVIATAVCASDGVDLACFGGDGPVSSGYIYDVSSNTVTEYPNILGDLDRIKIDKRDSCVYYNNNYYCFGHDNAVNGLAVYEMSDDLTSSTKKTGALTGTPHTNCELQPGTDIVWCIITNIVPSKYYTYDIGDDAWTYKADTVNTQGKVGADVIFNPDDPTELWIVGGRDDSSDLTDTIIAFDTVGLTETPVGNLGEDSAYANCMFYEDVLYCFGGSNSDDFNQKSIPYYDTVGDVGGILTTEYPDYFSYGACGQVSSSTFYCVGGYAFYEWDDWDYNIYEIEWVPPEPADGDDVTEDTTYSEGNNSIPNNLTVSGNNITVNFGGSVLTNGSVIVSGDNVVVTNLVVEDALVVTGSNVDYSGVERVGITFEEFRVSVDSTDLIVEVDLTDVDLVLEEVDGKIDFDTNIDLSVNGDLDVYVDIGINSITVDSVSAPNLDVSARITFYDTGYQTEEEVLIYKNGELCTTDCDIISVNNGVVVADVTGFSTYMLVGVGLDISQENFETLRSNMIYILGAFATVVILIAAMIILTFIFSGAQVDMMQIIVVVLMLAVGFAALLAVFVTIMRNFGVV